MKANHVARYAHFRFVVFHETWKEAKAIAERELRVATFDSICERHGIVK